jgi:glutaredoxin
MIEIYSKPNCGWCESSKTLFGQRNLLYTEYQIGRDITREEFLEKFPNARTVPLILIEGKVIGGYNDVVTYLDDERII